MRRTKASKVSVILAVLAVICAMAGLSMFLIAIVQGTYIYAEGAVPWYYDGVTLAKNGMIGFALAGMLIIVLFVSKWVSSLKGKNLSSY